MVRWSIKAFEVRWGDTREENWKKQPPLTCEGLTEVLSVYNSHSWTSAFPPASLSEGAATWTELKHDKNVSIFTLIRVFASVSAEPPVVGGYMFIDLPAAGGRCCGRLKRSSSMLQSTGSGRTLNKGCVLSASVKYILYHVPQDNHLTNPSCPVELHWQHMLLPDLVHLGNWRIGEAILFKTL